jgi:hypothetical protein
MSQSLTLQNKESFALRKENIEKRLSILDKDENEIERKFQEALDAIDGRLIIGDDKSIQTSK